MSFGASPSDIIIVVTFCKSLYRKCRDAGGEYDEISREVKGLHIVLRHLKYEVEAPESPLNRDRSIWGRQLAPIIGDCDFTLRQLDTLLSKYGRLASASSSPTSPRILWDKVRFGSNEMDQLGTVRVKLISHKTGLTLFLDTIQLHQSGKMANTLDNHGGQLDVILDKVDKIAAKMGQANGSIMTNYDDDDKEVWKQFRRELVAEGFSSDVLQQHKDVLRAYIREIDQKGLLEDITVDPHIPPTKIGGVNPERWLEGVQSAPSEDTSPSFRSEDSSVKEMVAREENLKFPTTMRFERPKPETRGGDVQRQLGVPSQGQERRRASEGNRPHTVPRLIASDEKEVVYHNTSGSSEEDSETEKNPKRSKLPSNGLVIRTSDLVASSQALALRPPGSPPLSYRSQGSFGEEDAMRSMAQRQKKQVESSSSPIRSRSIPNPSSPNPMLSNLDRIGTMPRPDNVRLAPDEHGNEIPLDAKWTRINRRLVSPEVLDQDRRRYEARPDFVAVLGLLSRSEIEDLAARTAAHRHARHIRNHPPPPPPPTQQLPPQQPSRPAQTTIPIPVPIPMPIPRDFQRPNISGRDTPSTDDQFSYSSSSDSSSHPQNRRKYQKQPTKRGYQGSDIGVPISGYPNPFGQPAPPPSPMWSPSQPAFVPSSAPVQGVRFPNSPPDSRGGGGYYTHEPPSSLRPRERERERSRDDGRERRDRDRDDGRGRERRKHSTNGGTRHGNYPKGSNNERERGEAGKGKSRWKENLTAAGIGGAAVSLLNVLSEAAEGI